jgi:chemotaxis protein MotB
MPNLVRIEGHTDGLKYGNGPAGYTNWELSTERANAARREMVRGGLQEGNVSQVVGFADTIRLNPSNPNDPLNRRISITVQNKTAGGLPSAKPAAPSPAPAALEKGQAAAKSAPTAAVRTPAAGQPPASAPAQASGTAAPASSDQSGRTPVLVLPPRPQLGPAAAGAPPKK